MLYFIDLFIGGLADNANYFMISNCFITAIVQLIKPDYLIKKILRKIEISRGIESVLTQEELHK